MSDKPAANDKKTVGDIKAARETLSEAVAAAARKFYAETGLTPDLQLHAHLHDDAEPEFRVTVRATLA